MNGQCPFDACTFTRSGSVGMSVGLFICFCLSVCRSVCLCVCLPACLPACLAVRLCVYLCVYLYFHLSVYLCVYVCVYLCFYLSVCLCLCVSFCLSICVSAYLTGTPPAFGWRFKQDVTFAISKDTCPVERCDPKHLQKGSYFVSYCTWEFCPHPPAGYVSGGVVGWRGE